MQSCNILQAINRYSEIENKELGQLYDSSNQINRKGDQLEFFVKDLFCGTFDVKDKEDKNEAQREYLSWLGRQNHPPDFMIRGGEAIEVKKLTSKAGSVQLNSSHPHQKLTSGYERLTNECVECEDDEGGWSEKDMVYALGRIERGTDNIDFLWVVYGDCWCAPSELYDALADKVSAKINEGLEELEYGKLNEDTNEIGRVNEADPCARTKLRIRPMWQLAHPAGYFSEYIENYSQKIEKSTPMFTVLTESKFESFPDKDKQALKENPRVEINPIDIPDPSNSDHRVKALIIQTEG